jgi:hypothetical protein
LLLYPFDEIGEKMINNYQYWPFPVSTEERQLSEELEKLEFLESIYSDGFKSYREVPGESLYGAKSNTHSGIIIQRSFKNNRWELRLNENIERRLVAFVTDFRIAGKALRAWLNGKSMSDILIDVSEYLINVSGTEGGYTVYDPKDEQYWPFPVSTSDKQSPEEAEKIKFLESIYSDGCEVYRVRREKEQERYVARCQSRLGSIMQWGSKKGKSEICWQLSAFDSHKQLTAFITDFRVTGTALRACLNGQSVSDTLEDIREYLTIPSGFNKSYTMYDVKAEP